VTGDIEVHFNRLGRSGWTLVVVVVGAEVYGVAHLEPSVALNAVARKASDDLAQRGQPIDASVIVARGHEGLGRGARIADVRTGSALA
jgi:hypothetical protein